MENEFIKTANIIHNQIYDYSKINFKGYDTPISIICPKHGIFWQRPDLHICGEGCPYCGNTNKLKIASNNFLKNAKLIHGDKYDYSKVAYINAETKVCIICPEHGEFWKQPYIHIAGQGCPHCNNYRNSKISKKIEKKLKELKISYNKEQTFDWLKNKGHMFLDYYLPEYNVAIECHGEQHFKPIDFFGGVDEYNERKNRDLLKYKLCSEHNIKIYYFTDIHSEYFDKLYYDENILMEDICKKEREAIY
jgi:hypothetical protein